MNNPTQQDLAAAREIDKLAYCEFGCQLNSKKLASIIAKHRSAELQALRERFTRYEMEIEELQRKLERLLETFRHRHANNGKDDSCFICGLDLRNEIHATMKETK